MASPVTLDINDGIADITIDLPPVNAINQAIRAGLLECFQSAIADDSVKAIVLLAAGRTYMAGADINEFDTGVGDPAYYDVFRVIENSDKIVVTALHGTALGGGLETALACHYRCADANARMGLPELSLGIIPGAGGSQRLPRLIGAKAAVEMIFGVAPIKAEQALELGLIDSIVESDLRGYAIAWAKELVQEGAAPRRTGEMDVDLSGYDKDFLRGMRALAGKRMRGQEAPERLLDAVEFATKLPLEDGLAEEKRIGDAAVASAESEALRHIFFAEREVAKVPGIEKSTPRVEVEMVGILGSGTMGTGIGIVFGNAGYTVRIIDPSQESLDNCKATIEKTQASQVERGRMDQAKADDMLSRMSYVTSYDGLADVDLVIEAVFEDMDLKKEIFAKLDDICKPGAILASNSSTLNIDDMAAVTSRPGSVVGLHFFSPANIMKLLEIVRAEKTSQEVLATAVDIGKRIRKVAVVVGIGSTFGFVGNRMMVKGYIREADQMLLEGASVQDVDKAIYDFGLPMGPWTMNDMGGVDIMCSVLESTGARAANPEPFYNVTLALGEAGLLGQKTGQGFYRYEKGDRTPIYNPWIEEIIAGEAERLNIAQTSLTAEEIQQRCMFGLINEGARILEEGLVYRASDIDVIWIYGYGFPRFRGGPMFYADQIGLDKVYETVRGYHETLGNYWEPAPLLEQFAQEGKKFSDWTPE